ncbi:hypothetical protein HDU76_008068 [Blyttiomyces sp. JEL0837]|nr:hypothetical protein HDU76_008068 [Blyttiomyces sp. JEL0837]
MDSLPPIPPTAIKKIRTSDFDPYIKALSDVFDKFQYNRAIGLSAATEGTPLLSATEDVDSDSWKELLEIASKIIVLEEQGKKRVNSTHHTHRARMVSANAPPLDTVPYFFRDMDFNLGNPNTFAKVYENADFSKLSLSDVNLTSSLLQDKLTLFLETVDVHLIKEISTRSTSFFSALSTLQALHQETHECVTQINELRSKLSNLSKVSIKQGLEVGRLNTRRDNVVKLYNGVKRIATVQQTQPMIKSFLEMANYTAALDLMEDTCKELKGLGSDDSEKEGIDLSGVQCILHLSSQLNETWATLEKTMKQELVDVLIRQVQYAVESMDQTSKLSPTFQGAPVGTFVSNIMKNNPKMQINVNWQAGTKIDANRNFAKQLEPLVVGLLRMDKLGSALQLYKENLMREIKIMTRKFYPTIVSPPSDGDGSVIDPAERKKEQQNMLAKQLKAMTFDSFFDLMVMIFVTLLHVMQQTAILNDMAVKIINDAKDSGVVVGQSLYIEFKTSEKQEGTAEGDKAASPRRKRLDEDDDDLDAVDFEDDVGTMRTRDSFHGQNEANASDLGSRGLSAFSQMVSESSDVLLAVSDLSNARSAKLISVRSDQNARLNPKDFYRLFDATREFINGGEDLCGHHGISLKGTMLSQAKLYLNHFHDERSKQLAIVIENEQWVKAEVPVDFQEIVEQILAAGQSSNPVTAQTKSKSDDLDDFDDDEDFDGDLGSATKATPKDADKKPGPKDGGVKTSRYLAIDGHKYYVAGSVLLFLKMLADYNQCLENIPSLVTEILNRILDILKIFNSKVCQVILGAGATKSAGLKNINAGHIALAAQSVGAVLGTIPHLRSGIEKYLSSKQQVLLSDFDRISRDYKDHQGELYAKLVSIMNERLAIQIKHLLAVNWDSPESKDLSPDESSTVHIATMVKETATLHRVLVKYLSNETLRMIMADVFQSYNKKLEEELKKIDLFTSAGKNRLLMDVQFLIRGLATLDDIDGPGNHLEVVVNNIKIKDKRIYTPPAPPAATTPLASVDATASTGGRGMGSFFGTSMTANTGNQGSAAQSPLPGAKKNFSLGKMLQKE